MDRTSLAELPVWRAAALVRSGEASAEDLTQACLARIEAEARLGAFLTVDAAGALEAARAIDLRRRRGEPLGRLAGVPLGIKDAICVRDAPTTAGSKILTRAAGPGEPELDPSRGYRPPFDATVIERLRAEDAVFLGKCNMDEFAMGSSNENSAFFPAKNPWDETRAPGGSSGGSAVAVAAGMALGALGSDTGGSVRQPAALTGTVGIKPTYGRVSRYGLVAFASSLDQIGTFGSDVRSAALLLEVIAGKDPRDATSLEAPVPDLEAACAHAVAGLRVGVPEEYFAEGLDPAVEARVREGLRGLEEAGCRLFPVRMPHTRYAVASYYVVAPAEASSNLARFDGVRYGLRKEPVGKKSDLKALYEATRGDGFGAEVKRRILLGTYVLSAGYYDAFYLKAQKVRTLIRRDFDEAFRVVDVLAMPVSPALAFRLGEKTEDPLAMYLADVFTLPASMAGLPALSVPCGMVAPGPGEPELPVGLQLVAPALEEGRLCAAASAWEVRSPVRGARPPSRPRAAPGAERKEGA